MHAFWSDRARPFSAKRRSRRCVGGSPGAAETRSRHTSQRQEYPFRADFEAGIEDAEAENVGQHACTGCGVKVAELMTACVVSRV